jgi:hypothetical protein
MLARRDLRLHHVKSLLALAPIDRGGAGAARRHGAERGDPQRARASSRLVRRLPGVPG